MGFKEDWNFFALSFDIKAELEFRLHFCYMLRIICINFCIKIDRIKRMFWGDEGRGFEGTFNQQTKILYHYKYGKLFQIR